MLCKTIYKMTDETKEIAINDTKQQIFGMHPDLVGYDGLSFYGSTEEPLFALQDVADFLKVTKINLSKEIDFEGEDYCKMKVHRGGQIRELIFLTEQGLYNIISRSVTPIGRKFRRYVKVVLKELRTKGTVSREIAEQKYLEYEQELAKTTRLMHEQRLLAEKNHDKYAKENKRANDEMFAKYNFQEKLDDSIKPGKETDAYKAEKYESKFGKALKLFIEKIPEYKELDITEDKLYDWKNDIVPEVEDEDRCFSIKFGATTREVHHEILVFPTIKIEDIKEKLINYRVKDCKHDHYWCAIEDIKRVCNDLFTTA